MNLRIARKIIKAVGTPRESAYTDFQIGKAVDRVEKTRSAKEDARFFRWMCELWHRSKVAEVISLDDLSDLPELSDDDRAAMDALGDDFIDRLLAGERPLTEASR